MADISDYISTIQTASRGEEVRDAIVDALNAINDAILSAVDGAITIALADLANADDNEY